MAGWSNEIAETRQCVGLVHQSSYPLPLDLATLKRFLQEMMGGFSGKIYVSVDYRLEEAIAAGKYGYVNPSITSTNFPSIKTSTTRIEIALVSHSELQKMNEQGLRDADLWELLAVGASRPDLQCEFPIIARGSCWEFPLAPRRVPYLYCSHLSGERYLDLLPLLPESDWYSHCRFAAVRK